MTIYSRGARQVRSRPVRLLFSCIGSILTLSASTLLADALDEPPEKADASDKPPTETVTTMPLEQAVDEFQKMADEKTRIFLNDLSARRRVTTLFANRQSARRGVQENFVNTSSGNLTFMVRDMVRIGGMPIVFGRVYDSSQTSGGDFGPGWKITVQESIVADGADFVYTDTSGTDHRLHVSGDKIAPAVAAWTPIQSGAIRAGGNVIVLESKDLTRRFKRMGDTYRLVAVSHPWGSMRLEYDSSGLLSSIASRYGSVAITRRGDGRIVSARDDLGRTVTYEYDAAGRLDRSFDMGGESWKYGYAEGGAVQELAEITDPRGNKMLEASYQAGRVDAVRVLRTRIRFTYGDATTEARDVLGRTTTFHVAPSGVTEGITDPSGVLTQVTFDDRHRPVKVSRDGASAVHFGYDDQGRLKSVRGEDGESTEYAYNQRGIIAASGAETARYRYRDGRLTYARDARGTRSYQYDDKGVLNAMAMDDNEVQLDVDASGLIFSVQQDGERLMDYSYDPRGRVQAIGFGHGDEQFMVSYRYNPRGFREAASYSYGTSSRITYDAAGNMVYYGVTYPGDKLVTQDYEIGDYNELLRVRNGGIDSPDVSYRYDEAGRVYDIQAGERVATVSYDNLDRATRVTLDGTTLLKYDYGVLEVDAIAKADALSGGVWVAGGTSIVFGTMESIVYSRPRPLEFGPVAYQPALKTLYVETSYLAPDAVLLSSLARRMIPFDGEQVNSAPFGSDKPSNSLFIPPEYRSVNCSICSSSSRGLVMTIRNAYVGLRTEFRLSPRGTCSGGQNPYAARASTWGFWRYAMNYGDGTAVTVQGSGQPTVTTAKHVYKQYSRYHLVTAAMSCSCNSPMTVSRATKRIFLSRSCSRSHRDGFAALTMGRYPREPFERGFEWRCNRLGNGYDLTYVTNSDPSGSAVNLPYTLPSSPTAPRPPSGGGGVFTPQQPDEPDNSITPFRPWDISPWRPTFGGGQFFYISRLLNFSAPSGSSAIDPCVTLLPLWDEDGVAHSHPYFENTQQFNAGAGCNGRKAPRSAARLAYLNEHAGKFSHPDIETAIEHDLNSYLITPIDRDILVYDRRKGHWYSTRVLDRHSNEYDPSDYD